MRTIISLALSGVLLFTASPAIALTEECIAFMEADAEWQSAVDDAEATYNEAFKEAHSKMVRANGAANKAYDKATHSVWRKYGVSRELDEARDKAEIIRNSAYKEAKKAFEVVTSGLKEARDKAITEADVIYSHKILEAWQGPRSDNMDVMNRLLERKMRDCGG